MTWGQFCERTLKVVQSANKSRSWAIKLVTFISGSPLIIGLLQPTIPYNET